jgi:hypothetical protein
MNGKGYGPSLQRPLLWVLQTSPNVWSWIGSELSEGDLNSLWYELQVRDAHKEATNANLFICVFGPKKFLA